MAPFFCVQLRRAILLSKSITLEHVREAHILQKSRKSLPKLTKMAAAELVLDAGVDLYESVDQDMLHDRLAGLVEAGGNETEDAEQDDESNSGINQWRGEEVKESWMYYIQGKTVRSDSIFTCMLLSTFTIAPV